MRCCYASRTTTDNGSSFLLCDFYWRQCKAWAKLVQYIALQVTDGNRAITVSTTTSRLTRCITNATTNGAHWVGCVNCFQCFYVFAFPNQTNVGGCISTYRASYLTRCWNVMKVVSIVVQFRRSRYGKIRIILCHCSVILPYEIRLTVCRQDVRDHGVLGHKEVQ